MSHEAFQPTENWPLQEYYKRSMHERIRQWGHRVAPLLESMQPAERQPRERLFEHLVTSVERDDVDTARVVEALDGYARQYLEGPGPYGRGGGSVETVPGYNMCQAQFEGLYAIYEAGAQHTDV